MRMAVCIDIWPLWKPFCGNCRIFNSISVIRRGWWFGAIGTASLGIDAEKIRPYPGSVLRKMTEEERVYIQSAGDQDEAFMRVWTMKEAMIKLTGEGLAAFAAAKCVPGKPLSGMTCRQMLWQGQYVITAIEK